MSFKESLEKAHSDILQFGQELHKKTVVQNYKEYELGQNIDIEDIEIMPNYPVINVFNIIKLMFDGDGVPDKIYLTITSDDTGETIFYGRNMYLRTAPVQLLSSKIIAIDDCGVNGTMNLIIRTKDWKSKENLAL